MGRIDKEQAVFEQLTLSDFKKWSSTALKTFNNYTIIMTNSSDKIRMSCIVCTPTSTPSPFLLGEGGEVETKI